MLKLKDYLEEELAKICVLEAKTNKTLVVSVDEADEIYKQIQLELMNDQDVVEEMLRMEQLEVEASLAATVTCPLCFRTNLMQENGHIYCPNVAVRRCEFQVDMRSCGFDLAQLKNRLENRVAQHACSNTPVFMFESENGGQASPCCLIMMCESCGFMQSVF